MRAATIVTLAAGVLVAVALAASDSQSDAVRGRQLFEKRCSGCHNLDGLKAGPPLRGVFGRMAARDARYPYSDALKRATVVWDAQTLDRWLTDPDSLVPGNDMSFRLDNAGERAAIVAFLRQQVSK